MWNLQLVQAALKVCTVSVLCTSAAAHVRGVSERTVEEGAKYRGAQGIRTAAWQEAATERS
jgi:hypothetical protein